MVMSLYSIYYRRSKCFGSLWEAKNHGEAVDKFRHVLDGMSDEFAADCELYYLAVFDQERGFIGSHGQQDFITPKKVDPLSRDIANAPENGGSI
jgi:hypothetical protein